MADDSDADKASSGDDHVAQPVKKQNKKKGNKKSSFQQMAELDDEQLSGADSDGIVWSKKSYRQIWDRVNKVVAFSFFDQANS